MPFSAPQTDLEPKTSFTAPQDELVQPATDQPSPAAALEAASSLFPPIDRSGSDMESATAGGPQLRQAGSPGAGARLGKQVVQGLKEAQTTSLLDDVLPTAEVNKDDSVPVAVGKEAYNLLAGIPKFATSGAGFEAGPAAVAAPVAAAGAFTGLMIKDLGSKILSTYKDWHSMSTGQKAAAITDMAGTGAFAGLLGRSAVKGVAEKLNPQGESNATVSEPGTGKLLQRESVQTGSAGGERSGVEQGQQGQEAAAPAEALIAPATPAPPDGDKVVTVQRPDGSTYPAAFGGKVYEKMGPNGEDIPSIAVVKDGQWSHGILPSEDTILPEGAKPDEPDDSNLTIESTIPLDPESGSPLQPAEMADLGADRARARSNGNRDIGGVAARIRSDRAAAEMTNEPVAGEGVAPEVSVARGQQLLKDGADPEKSMSDFENTGKISEDDMALGRAHLGELEYKTNKTEEAFGSESPEFDTAKKAESDWYRRYSKMRTLWARLGQGQQGGVDIDTGTFSGLAREFRKNSGEEFTPKQAGKARKLSKSVNDARAGVENSKQKLYDKLDKEFGGSDPERRALDAANRTVREAADRLAKEETKTRVATAAKEKAASQIREKAARKALEAAQKTVRDAAAKLAKSENDSRIRETTRPENVQEQATKDALSIANEVVRENAKRLAKAENDARNADSARSKKAAEAIARDEAKRLKQANARLRKAAIDAAKAEVKARIARADTGKYLWSKARAYIDAGDRDLIDVVRKVATETGRPIDEVRRELARPKGARKLTDELYQKQQTARRLHDTAKRWVAEQTQSGLSKVLPKLARMHFGLKTAGHGFVAMGTHAPSIAFQPHYWKTYAQNFGKMYTMVFSRAAFELAVRDLEAEPNFVKANRAGLVNDPRKVEDFNNPQMAAYLGKISGAGNRGYFALKTLRQDMFDQQWNKLPKKLQTDEMAEAIADGVNHATGVVRTPVNKYANVALFAPKLGLSRAAWLGVDPARAAATLYKMVADPKSVTPAERYFALAQVKEKATVVGTLLALLGANQGVLSATGQKQKINLTDPMSSDWLKFKGFGMNASYGNAMINMVRLPLRLAEIRASDGGKLKHIIYPDESMGHVVQEFARTQFSPLASLATDIATKGDYQNRPLPQMPFSGPPIPVPKRLAAQGIKPYTWTEFALEQAFPIPAEEAAKEVFRHGFGASPEQAKAYTKALFTIMLMTGTGGRVSEDLETKK